jgi:threonyl-tRNA synthetase
MLLEHYGAALPAWLCPTQVLVVPIAEPHEAWASAVLEQLRGAGLRALADFRRETLAKRIAEAHAAAVPFVAVIGAREVEARSASIRARDRSFAGNIEAIAADVARQCASPFGLPA